MNSLNNIQELLKGTMKEFYIECEDVWLRKEIIKRAREVR